MASDLISIESCRYPVRLYRSFKDVQYVRCGRCDACKASYRNSWRQRLKHHISCGLFHSVFITLTYDNEHLPIVRLDNSLDDIYQVLGFSRTRFVLRMSLNGEISSVPFRFSDVSSIDLDSVNDYLCNVHKDYLNETFPHYVISRPSKEVIVKDTSPSFAVVSKKDIQDFIKRLRTSISRNPLFADEDREVTYFICSEYGPKTFRPHYHGILFFKSQNIAEWAVNHGVYDSWRKQSLPIDSYGNKIASHVTMSEASASYVSKYVTCDDLLPTILNIPEFSNFHLQSISTPIGSLCLRSDDVPSLLEKGDILDHTQYYDKSTHEKIDIVNPFPSSFWRTIFPKFVNDRLIDDTTRLRLLTRISQFDTVEDFPDYRELMHDKFGLDEFVPNYYFRKGPFVVGHTNKAWMKFFDTVLSHGDLSPYFRHISSVIDGYKITPAYLSRQFIFPYPSSRDLDYFLFGFSQNRTACKKIHKLLKFSSWCFNSPQLYLRYRNQYCARLFSDLYFRQAEFMNKFTHLPNLESYVYNFESQPHFDSLNQSYFHRKSLSSVKHKTSRLYHYDAELQK